MSVEDLKKNATEVAKKPTVDSLFTKASTVDSRRGVKLLVWGEPEVGKTFFALSCPEPIYVISTEFGVHQNLHHFKNKDIRIMECSEPYAEKPIDQKGQVNDEPFEADPVASLLKVEAATEALKDITQGTIVVDSVSDIWSWLATWMKYHADMKQSAKGKEYMMRTEWQDANAKYRWLIMRLLSRPCHVVLTSRSGAVYDSTGNATTMTKAKAQGETSYFIDISVHMQKMVMPTFDANKVQNGMVTKKIATVEKCRFHSVNNMQIEDLTFDKLKTQLAPFVPQEVFDLKPVQPKTV